MKNVLELIRVSTEAQAGTDRASIPSQREVNARTCARYGLRTVGTIQITDVSGANVLQSPEMQDLIRRIASPDIHGVVAREFSRLMRPERLTDYALLQEFIDTKTIVYFPDGPLDLASKSGRLMGTIRAAIAGMERTEILERIWSAKEVKRRNGEHPQNHKSLPWGVSYLNGVWSYDPMRAPQVREAFQRLLAGETTYYQIAKLLGVSVPGARSILRNPIWTGWRVIDTKRDLSTAGRYAKAGGRQADRRKIKRAADEIIRHQVIAEPLVAAADFEAVQRLMAARRERHWRVQDPERAMFTYNGFLTCSGCGKPIYTRLAKRYYYVCAGRIPGKTCQAPYMLRDRLEPQLDQLVAKQLVRPEFLLECADYWRARQQAADPAADRERIEREMQKLRARRENILEAFYEGLTDKATRDQKLAPLAEQLRAAEQRLAEVLPMRLPDGESLLRVLRVFRTWATLPRDKKRALLGIAVASFQVSHYQIEAVNLHLSAFRSAETPVGRDILAHDILSLPIPAAYQCAQFAPGPASLHVTPSVLLGEE